MDRIDITSLLIRKNSAEIKKYVFVRMDNKKPKQSKPVIIVTTFLKYSVGLLFI